MRVLLAESRGFCAGVKMAIATLEQSLRRFGSPIYVYHEIVHNRRVVDSFRRRGVVFVDRLDEVPDGAYLVFSAHGVSPRLRAEAARRGLVTIDATCPLVTKVHREAVQLAREGYTIVLIGHAGHDEVLGTMGEAPHRIVLVETLEDVERLQIADPNRVAYLTQTTLSVDDAARIIDRLRQRFPAIVGPRKDDICYATQNRQEAVRRLAPVADVALIVGSANSSNSRRLAELAGSFGIPAYLIDGADDIDPQWLYQKQCVLLTAGASAPEELVQQCCRLLVEQYGAVIQTHVVCEEKVRFPLPPPVREENH